MKKLIASALLITAVTTMTASELDLVRKRFDVTEFLSFLERYIDGFGQEDSLKETFLAGPRREQEPKADEIVLFLDTLKALGFGKEDFEKFAADNKKTVANFNNELAELEKKLPEFSMALHDAKNILRNAILAEWLNSHAGSTLLLLYTNIYYQASLKLGKDAVPATLSTPEHYLNLRANPEQLRERFNRRVSSATSTASLGKTGKTSRKNA